VARVRGRAQAEMKEGGFATPLKKEKERIGILKKALRNQAANIREEMQPIKCSEAQKISVQEKKVERGWVQPHFFLLSSEIEFLF